jgi:hypothetical protein
MKTALLWLALVLVGIGAALYFGRSNFETGTADRPWPLGLGKTLDAPKHFPSTKDNEAAGKLVSLAAGVHIDLRPSRGPRWGPDGRREDLTEYLRTQLERSSDVIDAPPAEIAEYLQENEARLDEILDHLLNGPPIVWEMALARTSEPREPSFTGHLQLERVLVARALHRARNGEPGAWDDLHAAWNLARTLWVRPELDAILTALNASRMVNGAARKMPLPPPDWLQEVWSYDYDTAMTRTHQVDAWRAKSSAATARLRPMADEVLRARACDPASPTFVAVREKLGARAAPNVLMTWERLMRFRAEREATQRILQLRSGAVPAKESRCADGTWEVTARSVRFTRDIESRRPQFDYPLEYTRPSS